MKTNVWTGCYTQQWKGVLTNASFVHPAKMARGLLDRILLHGFQQGYWKPGDLVGDCFGGVGTTGLVGAYKGLRVVCVELEPRFVALARDNFAKHAWGFDKLRLPQPKIIQGDSRFFDSLIQNYENFHVCSLSEASAASTERSQVQVGQRVLLEGVQQKGKECVDLGGIEGSPLLPSKRPEELSVHSQPKKGRGKSKLSSRSNSGKAGISEAEEISVRDLRQRGQSRRPPQEQQSLRQPIEQSSNTVQFLPHETNHVGEVTGKTIGSPIPEKQRTSGLETKGFAAILTSPPYAVINAGAGGLNHKPPKKAGQQSGRSAGSPSQIADPRYGAAEGQIAKLASGSVDAVLTSPPYADSIEGFARNTDKGKYDRKAGPNSQQAARESYGAEPGQIGVLKSGNLDAVVASPPFRDARSDTTKSRPTQHGGPCAERHHTTQAGAGYGQTEGQIDALKTGELAAVVTSPPWENNCEGSRKGSKFKDEASVLKAKRGHGASDKAVIAQAKRDQLRVYGNSPGQIGQLRGGHPVYPSLKADTYWFAMAEVYRACFRAIKPGGVIVLIVKDYVKAKKRVPLCDDTARLLEHLGFVVIERIHAMLKEKTVHADLFVKEGVTGVRSRASFFRRLAEKNGSPEINWEEVIVARK